MKNLDALIEVLLPCVFEAGNAIMDVYKEGATARIKSDDSPVTIADERAEKIILKALGTWAPAIPVISEENTSSHRLEAPDAFFLVDPLDGTKEFLKMDGKGAFTVNIGLIHKRTPIMGIVYAPALDRLFCGIFDPENGEGEAFERDDLSKNSIKVRIPPSTGPVAVASQSHRDNMTNQWLDHHNITQTVSIGSSLKFCLCACGEADIYPRFGPTMEWDTAAGDAVLRAAGGRVETPEGEPYLYGKSDYRNSPFIAYGGVTG